MLASLCVKVAPIQDAPRLIVVSAYSRASRVLGEKEPSPKEFMD